jgi:hypothetical protein
MPAKAKVKKSATSPVRSSAPDTEAELKGFFPPNDEFENFRCCRYYWQGGGKRTGLAAKLNRKRFPVPPDAGGHEPTAAWTDYLPPPFAPAEYLSLEHTVRRYEELMPEAETHAYVQFTVEFPRPFNLAHPFEMVRSWAKRDYVEARHLPVFLAGHAPVLAGSSNCVHVHAVILPRRLTQLGFGEFDRSVPNDKGRRAAFEAWLAFKTEWYQAWPSFLSEMP